MLSQESLSRIDRELEKYPGDQKKSATMSALRIAQEELGWLSNETIAFVADYLGLTDIEVFEVASFYNMYELAPVGRHKITVCTNLPCALSGGVHAAEYVKQKLGIDFNETTPDGKFTLKEGECMGACGDAPVLLVNNHHMCSWMTPEKIDQMLADLDK
ncbi:MAG: NADH-quinone oxidoreductase subunit NuoE [Rhodocyclaceae bacterium]|nr:NADH-quinone oxidoreductase subunit NuoE [Rhodocyclaceae bacterium]